MPPVQAAERARNCLPRRLPFASKCQKRLRFAGKFVLIPPRRKKSPFHEAVCLAEARLAPSAPSALHSPEISSAVQRRRCRSVSDLFLYRRSRRSRREPVTGWITVPKIWIAHDIGRALNLLRPRSSRRQRLPWASTKPHGRAGIQRLPKEALPRPRSQFPSMLSTRAPLRSTCPTL